MKHDNIILVTSKTKVFKVTTSNTWNLKSILAFTLQIFLVLVYWTMSFLRRHDTVHFDDFLILVTSETKVFKVITSNTRNLKGIPAFTLQIFLVLIYWTISFLCRHVTVHSNDFLILVPLKPRLSRSLLQTQGTSRVFQHLPYRFFVSGLLDNVIPSQTCYSTF